MKKKYKNIDGKQIAKLNNTNAIKFKTLNQLKEGIDSYFKYVEENKKVPQILGLCQHLSVTYKTFQRYRKGEFNRTGMNYSEEIEFAIERLEVMLVNKMFEARNPVPHIFYLKCRFNYREQQDMNITTDKIEISFD